MKITNHEKIITLLSRYPGRWFLPQDFMKRELGNLFIGYMADRRLRELKVDYPKAFKVEKERNQLKVRLDLDNIKDWFYDLPDKYRKILRQEGLAPDYSEKESLERLNLMIVED